MKTSLYIVALCAALVAAAPAPEPAPAAQPAPEPAPAGDNTPEIIEIIAPAASAQETLATLNLGAPGSELSERNKRTIGILRQLFPSLTQNALAEENQLLSGAESQQAEVRVAFGEPAADQQPAASDDQQVAAQTNAASIDEITLDDADSSEENRNKRFLSFGGSAGGSGGGSGNFLFDIVRLVAGSSSGSSSGDAGAGADGEDASAAKGDNLTEGVPGPITRLFIIANRGIANLIQDLILRIAQTSERIVNFKARLITSII
ncbi:synaptonemal complex protein 4 isoform X2 [Trichoplusia ni]|uniref:Synaptonemal complex protein 4 isoform X2 n=1 Tax=Trichoplusia ni TaxID=7111 RepID=A0A7E5W4V6_TRINI|nr:synaptonemal complex protein 4 isoform X2 [Trichoplusia ni]